MFLLNTTREVFCLHPALPACPLLLALGWPQEQSSALKAAAPSSFVAWSCLLCAETFMEKLISVELIKKKKNDLFWMHCIETSCTRTGTSQGPHLSHWLGEVPGAWEGADDADNSCYNFCHIRNCQR